MRQCTKVEKLNALLRLMYLLFFITSLFLTFLVVRVTAYSFHDMKNYGTKREKSKTITGYLRVKTGYDWHHFHFGIIICAITLFLILLFSINNLLAVFLGIGISMIVDQCVPIIDKKSNYFHKKNLAISFTFHIIIGLIAIIINHSI